MLKGRGRVAFFFLFLSIVVCKNSFADNLNYIKLTPEGSVLSFGSSVEKGLNFFPFNPASIASSRGLQLLMTHSLRHFPGRIKNLDQLDSDIYGFSLPFEAGKTSFGFLWMTPHETGFDWCTQNSSDENGKIPRRTLKGGLFEIGLAHRNDISSVGFSLAKGDFWLRDDKTGKTIYIHKFFMLQPGYMWESSTNRFKYGVTPSFATEELKDDSGVHTKKTVNLQFSWGYKLDSRSDAIISSDVSLSLSDGKLKIGIKPVTGIGYRTLALDKKNLLLEVGYHDGAVHYDIGVKTGSMIVDYATLKDSLGLITGQNVQFMKDVHLASITLRF
ncbi:hypothetical protein Thena_0674 [Thermodesulfobium narugense DSM 14796]|uniref:Membrane protein involved in aromatic hydrocarbon degradation n=1 Tax=Thermodesulfobium narugense DSM 14796 TaxID=747365 RepID=M1E876_9BACT|nr:hypothetical protein [Thermodesulfobium narugense]AEE14309.1 hypothetical protein Thena_0674 [Thermodesulfobium narugense DSM 14796]